jgi:hypothetical protein
MNTIINNLSASENQAAIQQVMASGGRQQPVTDESIAASIDPDLSVAADTTAAVASVVADDASVADTTAADAGDTGTRSVVSVADQTKPYGTSSVAAGASIASVTDTTAADAGDIGTQSVVSVADRTEPDGASSVDEVAFVATATTTNSRSATTSSVGAVASTGPDVIVQHKLSTGAPTTSRSVPVSTADLDQVETENEIIAPQAEEPRPVSRVRSVASTGADPAARKGRSSRSSTTTAASGSLRSSSASISGASSSSTTEDPALWKGPRSSARSSAASSHQRQMPPSAVPPPSSSSLADTSMVASATTAGAGASMSSVPASTTAVAPEDDTTQGGESAPTDHGIDGDSVQVVTTTTETAPSSLPTPCPNNVVQPETYAGLSYNPDEIAGGEEGGIQAYVAGQVEDEAIEALGVVTESQLEAEENQKKRKYLIRGIALFVALLVVVIVPVVVVQWNKDGPGPPVELNITESPTFAPSSAPSSSTYFELLTTLMGLYDDTELFAATFDDPSSPQYKAAVWAADIAPLGLSGSSPRMISRYSLAVLYFSTNGDEWARCGRGSTQCDVSEEWLTAESECDWYAITCKDPTNDDYTVLRIFFRKLCFNKMGCSLCSSCQFFLTNPLLLLNSPKQWDTQQHGGNITC